MEPRRHETVMKIFEEREVKRKGRKSRFGVKHARLVFDPFRGLLSHIKTNKDGNHSPTPNPLLIPSSLCTCFNCWDYCCGMDVLMLLLQLCGACLSVVWKIARRLTEDKVSLTKTVVSPDVTFSELPSQHTHRKAKLKGVNHVTVLCGWPISDQLTVDRILDKTHTHTHIFSMDKKQNKTINNCRKVKKRKCTCTIWPCW